MRHILLLLIFFVFSSCLNSIYAQYEGFTRSERKLYYKVVDNEGKQRRAKEGEFVTVSWRYSLNNDSLLFSTQNKPNGEQLIRVESHGFKGDYKEIFRLLGEGDSAICKVPVNFFYPRILGTSRPRSISGKSFIHMEFRLKKIQSPAELEEEKRKKKEKAQSEESIKVLKFLTQQNWNEEPKKSGLYFKELKKGTGSKPSKGNQVSMYYKGYLTNGITFDAVKKGEKPFTFIVGNNQVIDAWEEAVQYLNVGGKAVIICPSKLAYGGNGVPGTKVGPFEPLIFEIELLKVE